MTMLSFFITALVVVVLMAAMAAIILFVLLYTKVPFVRTPWPVIEKVLEAVKIMPEQTVYDLGCGNARILIEIEKHTGAKTVGFEISPWAYLLSQLNILVHRSKTKVHYKNFYKEDLAPADVIFCFLLDTVMPRVGEQLKRQLKPGATVISFAFAIKEWEPKKVLVPFPNKQKSSKIYIYQK